MNLMSIIFILSTLYYLYNFPHLEKNVDQKLLMYNNRSWILLDIVYYLNNIIYWVWIFALLFTQYSTFGIILISYSILVVSIRWSIGKSFKYESIFSFIKIMLLLATALVPFF